MIEQSNQALNWLINISTPDKDLHFLLIFLAFGKNRTREKVIFPPQY